jgi:hypothetical protein
MASDFTNIDSNTLVGAGVLPMKLHYKNVREAYTTLSLRPMVYFIEIFFGYFRFQVSVQRIHV